MDGEFVSLSCSGTSWSIPISDPGYVYGRGSGLTEHPPCSGGGFKENEQCEGNDTKLFRLVKRGAGETEKLYIK